MAPGAGASPPGVSIHLSGLQQMAGSVSPDSSLR